MTTTTLTHGASRVAVAVATVAMLACGPTTVRTGPPFALPSGPAQSSCEAREWLEIAPARTTATGTANYGLWATTATREEAGLAVYGVADEDPIEPRDLWPLLQEPDLERSHEARIEPVEARQTETLVWLLAALGVMAGGITFAAVAEDASPMARGVAGVGGVAGGLTLTIIAIARQPSAQDQAYALVRTQQFVPPEDDPRLVARGVEQANRRTRRRCSSVR